MLIFSAANKLFVRFLHLICLADTKGYMKRSAIFLSVLCVILAFSAVTVLSQRKTNRRLEKKPAQTVTARSTPQPEKEPEKKRNSRPDETRESVSADAAEGTAPDFIYEFTRPGFVYSKIRIVHDDAGKGTIEFEKKELDETFTDPLRVSQKTLTRINELLGELDFFNSAENYQYEKDYSHLGTARFTFIRGEKERTAEFNWTTNAAAKELADIYRGLSTQYVWQFEVNVSRENQPLQSPSLIDALDGYIRRKEIADPEQMLPFLKELYNDDRLPLMARNHLDRLIKQIEKAKK